MSKTNLLMYGKGFSEEFNPNELSYAASIWKPIIFSSYNSRFSKWPTLELCACRHTQRMILVP